MVCLELTKYLERGAKTSHKYSKMCSQNIVILLKFTFLSVHQLSPTVFSH